MSFLKPSVFYEFLPSQRRMPCQNWGFLRWPGFDGFLRLLVVFLLWSMFSEIKFIPSSSMYPTLRVGDRIIVERASYFFRSPASRDIVIFRDPTWQPGDGERSVFIKRIVAISGDLVQIQHGKLFVNGIAQKEDFIAGQPSYVTTSTLVPKGHVYALGDNRNNSYDSHIWGPLPVKNIIGRYVTRFYRPSNH